MVDLNPKKTTKNSNFSRKYTTRLIIKYGNSGPDVLLSKLLCPLSFKFPI